jgi:peptide/nickel transport system substrate-binding protein
MDDYRKTDSPGFAAGTTNPFLNPSVRKAVAEAIDVKAIRTKLFDDAAEPATQFMPPSAETYDANAQGFQYNPEDAKTLLAQAGYPNGFAVKLDATTHHYLQDDLVAQAIAGMLGQVGIKVDLNVLPSSAFFTKVDKGEESFYMAGWGTTSPFATYDALYHCVDPSLGFGKNNAEHYCNPAADKLMLDASAQFDAAKRVPLERQAMADTRKDVAYIPLYYQDVIAGVSDSVSWTSRFDEKIYAFEMVPK